jgi:hypothetical protein
MKAVDVKILKNAIRRADRDSDPHLASILRDLASGAIEVVERTPPEAHAEAAIEKLKMDAEHLQYERDEAREKLAAMEAPVDSLGDLPSSWPTNEAESAALSEARKENTP